MPASQSPQIPPYRRHPNGQAFVSHRSIATKSRRMYLGVYGTEESLQAYRAFLRRIAAQGDPEPPAHPDCAATIAELVLAYDAYALDYYKRPGGKMSSEYSSQRTALRFLMDLYGPTLGFEFGPKALKTIQRHMVQENHARQYVNKTIQRIRAFFRWCCSEELLPPELHHGLSCVKAVYPGQMGVREAPKIGPASWASVVGVEPYLSPTVAALMRVQYLCGMRPGEACRMRACDIDRSGDIWLYSPAQHKTQWRGKTLVKAVPLAAQQVLAPLIESRAADAYLFNPADAVAWCQQQQVANRPERSTPRYPSEVARVDREKRNAKRRKPRRPIRDHYQTGSYSQALRYGFEAAERAGVELVRFTPNQLRHAICTFISSTFGEERAQRYAGHDRLETTAIYTERDVRDLVAIARQLDACWAKAA